MNNQTCTFCNNPDSILSRETCCGGCSKITDAYQACEFKMCKYCQKHFDFCECKCG